MLIDAANHVDECGFHSHQPRRAHIGLGTRSHKQKSPPVLLAPCRAHHRPRLTHGRPPAGPPRHLLLPSTTPPSTFFISGGPGRDVAAGATFFASTYELFGQHVDDSRDRFDGLETPLPAVEPARGGVEWNGQFRPDHGERYADPLQQGCPALWLGRGIVSPTPPSSAGQLGLKLMLPIAFGPLRSSGRG